MARLTYSQLSKIDSALKRANTRIARLQDTYSRDSSVFKNQIAPFEKGPLHKYVGDSASGHWKLDKGQIMKDIRTGKIDFDFANEILRNAAGIQIDPRGEVVKSKFGGFQTRQQLEKEALQIIGEDQLDLLQKYKDENGFISLSKSTLKSIITELNELSEGFQTEYDDTPLDADEMKSNQVLSVLYSSDHGGSRDKRRLTYTEMQNIAEELAKIRKSLEGDNEKGKENNDNLKNEG